MAGANESNLTRNVIYIAVALLVILSLATIGVRLWLIVEPDEEAEPLPPVATAEPGALDEAGLLAQAQAAQQAAEQARLDANEALDAANEATRTLDLLLSFLEGAAVLAGLALGAAAYFGFRNLDQTNRELQSKLGELDRRRETLEQLDAALAEQRGMRQALQSTLINLVQAHQELSLSNYAEAYDAALRVLAHDPDNPQALYIAGWLELQFIPGRLDSGLERLHRALSLQRDWPAALAALGVGLRRKAQQATGAARRDLFNQSDGYLRQALGKNHDLIDLNRESFWGPVAGNARDNGLIDEAIAAYKEALKVTPASSYPHGNLAALYLQKAKTDPAAQPDALRAFRDTLQVAQVELALNPRDYFHMMDIAMSATMLGQEDATAFERAASMLDTTLTMGDVTDEMLRVSLGGWKRLHTSCPDEWIAVKAHLQQAIDRVTAAIDGARAG